MNGCMDARIYGELLCEFEMDGFYVHDETIFYIEEMAIRRFFVLPNIIVHTFKILFVGCYCKIKYQSQIFLIS